MTEIRPPVANDNAPLRALIFDSVYDSYRGVIVYVRVMDGKIKAGDTMRMMATGAQFTVVEVGRMRATSMENTGVLSSGEVGYITASIKPFRAGWAIPSLWQMRRQRSPCPVTAR